LQRIGFVPNGPVLHTIVAIAAGGPRVLEAAIERRDAKSRVPSVGLVRIRSPEAADGMA
jgi:hypothetical protein